MNVFTGNRARINGGITVSIRKTDVDRLIQEYDICTMVPAEMVKSCVMALIDDVAGAEFKK